MRQKGLHRLTERKTKLIGYCMMNRSFQATAGCEDRLSAETRKMTVFVSHQQFHFKYCEIYLISAQKSYQNVTIWNFWV